MQYVLQKHEIGAEEFLLIYIASKNTCRYAKERNRKALHTHLFKMYISFSLADWRFSVNT